LTIYTFLTNICAKFDSCHFNTDAVEQYQTPAGFYITNLRFVHPTLPHIWNWKFFDSHWQLLKQIWQLSLWYSRHKKMSNFSWFLKWSICVSWWIEPNIISETIK